MPPRNGYHTSTEKPCFHCYQSGHSRTTKCTSNGIIACTSCFRLNVFSKKCTCKNLQNGSSQQVLRIVGNKTMHKWYLDITIFDIIMPARINPLIARSQVSQSFANWLQANNHQPHDDTTTIIIITRRQGRMMRIECDISSSQDEHIQLGMDFMIQIGYTFTMKGVSIVSNNTPVMSNKYETEYVYNLPSVGKDLRNYLNNKRFFLKKGRVIKPVLQYPGLRITIDQRRSPMSDRMVYDD